MKILFLHLSDIHIKDKNTVTYDMIDKMILAITQEEIVNKIFIIMSGDLAYEGIKEQYEETRKLIGRIVKKLKQKYKINDHIDILLVPGNHDINFNKTPKSRAEIQSEFFKNNQKDEVCSKYIKMMDDFFEFASINRCFISNKILDIKHFEIGNYKIQFNLINSSINSTLKDPTEDDDKGLHFIDEVEINKMENNKNNDLVITVMHHSPEWFNESCRHRLLAYINNKTDFLLCGHEHVNSESELLQSETKVVRICGGPLAFEKISIFNTILLDTDDNTYKTCCYTLKDDIYYPEFAKEKKLKTDIRINSSFYNDFINDNTLENVTDFRELFVFPELIDINKEQKNQTELVINNKKLFDLIDKKKMLIIEGDDYSGKTFLSKYIYLELLKDKIPVFFNMKKLNSIRINKLIDFTIEEQYNKTQYSKSKFFQEPKSNKIAIVDDADKVDSKQYEILIDELKKVFDTIIIFKGFNSQYDVIELTKKHLEDDESTLTIKICPTYSEKREELIKKVYKILEPNITDTNLVNKAKGINKIITNQIQIFNLNPYFIVLFTKTMINSGYERCEANIFNSVFISNITNILKSNSNLDINVSLLILQRIAYYIHTNKEYPIKQSSINKIISDYNQEGVGYRRSINPAELINELITTRIINYYNSEGDISFANNSYLAYFVAKEWLKIIDRQELKKMVDNICFGINGDILLFICYLYENSQVLIFNTILEGAETFFKNYKELNLKENNVKYLMDDKKKIKLKLPTSKDKEVKQEEIKQQEKRLTANERLKYINVYDYDESTINDSQMIFLRGIKYIQILSKTLPDFIHSMNKDQIQQFVKAIYVYPNKLLYNIFKPINDLIVNETSKEKLKECGINAYEEIEKTIATIKSIFQTILLNVYDMTARFVASDNTINALENFNYQESWNYSLQNAIFYDNIGKTEEMGEKLTKLCKNNNKTLYNLATRVYQKHLLFNKIHYVGKVQSQIDYFFPNINKPSKYFNNKTRKMMNIRCKIK